MRKTRFLILVIALLPAPAMAAEQARTQKPDKAVAADRQLPLKGAGAQNSCAAHGPGFVLMAGTTSCMKIGGATSVGVGGSR